MGCFLSRNGVVLDLFRSFCQSGHLAQEAKRLKTGVKRQPPGFWSAAKGQESSDPQACSAGNALLGQQHWAKRAGPTFRAASQRALSAPRFFIRSSRATAKEGWWLRALLWCLQKLKQEAIHGIQSFPAAVLALAPSAPLPSAYREVVSPRGLSQWTESDAFSWEHTGLRLRLPALQ